MSDLPIDPTPPQPSPEIDPANTPDEAPPTSPTPQEDETGRPYGQDD